MVGLAEVSGSAVLTPVSHIVGSAAADLLGWIRGTEQAVTGQSKANQRTQLSHVSWIWNNLFYSSSMPCFKNKAIFKKNSPLSMRCGPRTTFHVVLGKYVCNQGIVLPLSFNNKLEILM